MSGRSGLDELAELLRRNPELSVLNDYTAVRDEPAPVYATFPSPPTENPATTGSFQSGDGWVKIILEDERPETWNKFWAGVHWQKRRQYKKSAVQAIEAVMPSGVTPFQSRVRVQYDVYFASRPQDWSNVCLKPYEDALRGLVIIDDDIRYIAGGTVNVYIDKQRPRIEITLVAES